MRPEVESGGCRTEIKCRLDYFWPIAVAGSIFCLGKFSAGAGRVLPVFHPSKCSPLPPSHREKKTIDWLYNHSVRPTRARAAHGPRLLRAPNVRSFPRLSKAPSANWCSSHQLVIAAAHGVVFGLGLDSLRHGAVFFSIQELGCRAGDGCQARVPILVRDTWFLG